MLAGIGTVSVEKAHRLGSYEIQANIHLSNESNILSIVKVPHDESSMKGRMMQVVDRESNKQLVGKRLKFGWKELISLVEKLI